MKKILFNDKFLLTQAVLAGRKTQTRRIVSQSLIYRHAFRKHDRDVKRLVVKKAYEIPCR